MRNTLWAAVVVILLCLVAFNRPAAVAQNVAPGAVRWEYARLLVYGVHMSLDTKNGVVDVGRGGQVKPRTVFAGLGSDGWELVGAAPAIMLDNVATADRDATATFVFKRPVR